MAQYPAAFPGQYTVAAGQAATATGPLDGTRYDLTVVGPNRFLRRFVGDTAKAGRDLRVESSYHDGRLHLALHNDGRAPVTFTVAHNQYIHTRPQSYKVAGRGSKAVTIDVPSLSHGWYDVTVASASDHGWAQRFAGHVETGKPSISG